MKLLTYLLLVNGIAATQSVDQASNMTQLAATTSTNTTTPQPANSLANLNGLPYDEAADKRIEKFGQAIEILNAVADVTAGLADAFDGTGLKQIMACVAGPLAVLSIVMMFLPKQPSPEERAIAAALETITKKMEVLHKVQMKMLS